MKAVLYDKDGKVFTEFDVPADDPPLVLCAQMDPSMREFVKDMADAIELKEMGIDGNDYAFDRQLRRQLSSGIRRFELRLIRRGVAFYKERH